MGYVHGSPSRAIHILVPDLSWHRSPKREDLGKAAAVQGEGGFFEIGIGFSYAFNLNRVLVGIKKAPQPLGNTRGGCLAAPMEVIAAPLNSGILCSRGFNLSHPPPFRGAGADEVMGHWSHGTWLAVQFQ